MIGMDSPQEEEFNRKNAECFAREYEAERTEKEQAKYGIPCDGCGNLFPYEKLDQFEADDSGIIHVCNDCL